MGVAGERDVAGLITARSVGRPGRTPRRPEERSEEHPITPDQNNKELRARATESDIAFMRLALDLARQAAADGEIPVGAVVVHYGRAGPVVVGTGANQRQATADPTAHAEIVALRQAGAALHSWQLTDCDLFATLEPCPMCAGALVNARLRRLLFGCTDPKAGAVETLYKIATDSRLNHRLQVVGGVLAGEAAELLRSFFVRRRKTGQ